VVAGVRLDFEPSVGHSLQLGRAHVAVNAVVEAGRAKKTAGIDMSVSTGRAFKY